MVRIRKHASSILSDQPATTSARTTQVKCELNLSPWDVSPFTPQSEFDYQIKIEDDYALYTWNNVKEEPLDTNSHRHLEQVRVKKREIVEHCKEEEDERSPTSASVVTKKRAKRKTEATMRKDANYVRCVKTDGKTWQCKKEAQQGEVLCEHHLMQLKSYYNKYNYSTTKKSKPGEGKARAGVVVACTTVAANKRRNRGRVQSKPADYYYYSGFGPSWGKKRRGGDEIIKEQLETFIDDSNEVSSSSLDVDCDHDQERATSSSMVDAPRGHGNEGVFYDYEDEDDDEEGNVGKGRIRKPIKARSLKSLL